METFLINQATRFQFFFFNPWDFYDCLRHVFGFGVEALGVGSRVWGWGFESLAFAVYSEHACEL